jgi:hypothetical protein
MRRRDFITLLGGGTVAWPLAARAQQPSSLVGVLHSGSHTTFAPFMIAFRRGLQEGGFIEGQNVTIEYRWAEKRSRGYQRQRSMLAMTGQNYTDCRSARKRLVDRGWRQGRDGRDAVLAPHQKLKHRDLARGQYLRLVVDEGLPALGVEHEICNPQRTPEQLVLAPEAGKLHIISVSGG